jgi:hypothetical protein
MIHLAIVSTMLVLFELTDFQSPFREYLFLSTLEMNFRESFEASWKHDGRIRQRPGGRDHLAFMCAFVYSSGEIKTEIETTFT